MRANRVGLDSVRLELGRDELLVPSAQPIHRPRDGDDAIGLAANR
jgi:hypothetical protein